MGANCIDGQELSAFLQGKLVPPRTDEILAHVDQCPNCQDTVASLSAPSDTFAEGFRQPQAPSPVESENALRTGLQRLLSGVRRQSTIGKDEALPEFIGPYRLLEQLGTGGMGAVYRATHAKLKRTVALKVLPSSRWSNPASIARFEREMEAIGQLDHPNFVRASDAGEDQGIHYLVMEFVDGLDLARLGKRLGQLPVADACELIRMAAIGLHYAHEHSLVHRDIKPSNLMLAWDRSAARANDPQPTLKILDLGLALLGDEQFREDHHVTTVGMLMGTLDYMPPEQCIDSHAVDHRADIYGLGATLFKLLTDQAPYTDPQHDTLLKKMTALATKTAPSIGMLRPDLPSSVISTVDRMLARDPNDRFSSANEVAEALAETTGEANLGALLRLGQQTADPVDVVAIPPLLSRQHAARSTGAEALATNSAGSSARRRWRSIIGMIGLFAMVAAAVILYLETDYGTITISSNAADLRVELKQTDQVVQTLEIEQGMAKTHVRAGQYEVEVVGGPANVSVEPRVVDVSRNGSADVRVSLPNEPHVAPLWKSVPGVRAFSLDEFETAIRNQQDVIVFFTAKWCLTGKALEKSLADSRAFRELVARSDLHFFAADVTSPTADAWKLLEPTAAKDSLPCALEFIDGTLSRTLTGLEILEERLAPAKTTPRYDGRTLSEWLDEVKFERKPDRLMEAIRAVRAMAGHPVNTRLSSESIDAIFLTLRQLGQEPGRAHSLVSELAWLTLTEFPVDQVADRAVQEIHTGNRRSRDFLYYFLAPVIGELANEEPAGVEHWQRTLDIRRAMSDRPAIAAIIEASRQDPEWSVPFLHYFAAHNGIKLEDLTDLELRDQTTDLFRASLDHRDTRLAAIAMAHMAKHPPHREIVLTRLNEALRKVVAAPSVSNMWTFSTVNSEEGSCLMETAIELAKQGTLGDHGHEIVTNMCRAYPTLTSWVRRLEDYFPSSHTTDYAPPGILLLQVLSALGSEAKPALPFLIQGYQTRLRDSGTGGIGGGPGSRPSDEIRQVLLTIDPALAEPAATFTAKDDSFVTNGLGEISEAQLHDSKHKLPHVDATLLGKNAREYARTRMQPSLATLKELQLRVGVPLNLVLVVQADQMTADARIESREMRSVEIFWPTTTVNEAGAEATTLAMREIDSALRNRAEAISHQHPLRLDLRNISEQAESSVRSRMGGQGGMGGGRMGGQGGMF